MTEKLGVVILLASVLHELVRADLRDIRLDCEGTAMQAELTFDASFGGVVFAKHHYKQDDCVHFGNGSKTMHIELPLYRGLALACGTRRMADGSLTLTVVVSNIKHVIVEGSREIELRCHYQLDAFTITMPPGGIQVLWPNASTRMVSVVASSGVRLANSEETPTVAMVIREGHGLDGARIRDAVIGQKITLDIFTVAANGSRNDFFVHNCMAFDGQTSTDVGRGPLERAEVQLIDAFGCAVRNADLSESELHVATGTDGRRHAYLYLTGFQFYTAETVNFECQIKTCRRPCQQPNCTTASSAIPAVYHDTTVVLDSQQTSWTTDDEDKNEGADAKLDQRPPASEWLDHLLDASSTSASASKQKRSRHQDTEQLFRVNDRLQPLLAEAARLYNDEAAELEGAGGTASDGVSVAASLEMRRDGGDGPTTVGARTRERTHDMPQDASLALLYALLLALCIACVVCALVVAWFRYSLGRERKRIERLPQA